MPSTGAVPRPVRSRALGRAMARLDRRGPESSVTLGEVADALRQLGPLYLLMAVACIAVSPLSGIPFVTTACGLSIAVLAGQLLLNRRAIWLPGRLRRRSVQVGRLRAGLRRADSVAGRMEAVMRRRLVWVTGGPVRVVLLTVCLVFGLTMPVLEIVPFAGTTLAALVLVIALALIARDGAVALLAGAGVSALLVAGAVLVT
ncbi:MAG: exopolysaccharide biosynthesis protein [Pseudomonadota bacterium]